MDPMSNFLLNRVQGTNAALQSYIDANATLTSQVHQLLDALNTAISERDALGARVVELQQQVTQLIHDLKVEACDARGRRAQVDAFKNQHPDSPLMRDTGKRYKKSGNIKEVVRIIYEQAFDEAARQRGIANPEEVRIG